MPEARVETMLVAGATRGRRRGRAVWVVGGLVVGLLVWAASGWWFRSSLAEARRAVAEGRHAEARQRLARLVSWWPGHDEVEFLLGTCERESGRLEAAVA